jgi:2-isopropylmalate synthase
MQPAPVTKYRRLPVVDLPDRQWPSRTIEHAPIWCSVDLRDGNQALAQPMSVEEKLEYFQMLVRIGFKQIEIGFPSASRIEFDFCRRLIEEDLIPDDVSIQILCQCREDLITRSLEALRGARHVIFHLYNSTSPKQREYVFNATPQEIAAIAVHAVSFLKEKMQPLAAEGTSIRLEYSPESFTSTELDVALAICEAVTDTWQPTPDNKIILNLPATVEYATPNVHADQIEWMARHLTRRDLTTISLHTHNDRGTGTAATELALLAGADRVEGTLFGVGERTGNLDIVTVALNLYTHGIHPGLDLSHLNDIRETYERCTRMEIHPRHPYAGDLAFTAFSGSHQDAIKKSWDRQSPGKPWDVLYIPVDPADIGRTYKAIIRINSQSGKGGVAYILDKEFGYQLPRPLQIELGRLVNRVSDDKGTELTTSEIHGLFTSTYMVPAGALSLSDFRAIERGDNVTIEADVAIDGHSLSIRGRGNGPIAAFVDALATTTLPAVEILNYSEHSLGAGADARAVSYIQIRTPASPHPVYGVGTHTNIELASIHAIVSALNHALAPAK